VLERTGLLEAPAVPVIMPTLSRPDYPAEALDSVLAQTC
jgi:hypothetical protein